MRHLVLFTVIVGHQASIAKGILPTFIAKVSLLAYIAIDLLAFTAADSHQSTARVNPASITVGKPLVNLASIEGIHPSTIEDSPKTKATADIAMEATRIITGLVAPKDTD